MKYKNLKYSIFIPTAFLAVFLLSGCNKNDVMENEQNQNKQVVEENKEQTVESNGQEAESLENQQDIPEENKIKNEDAGITKTEPKNCSADVIKYCPSDSFTDPNQFKKFLTVYEENFSKSEYEKYKKKFTEQFDKCQEALRCE